MKKGRREHTLFLHAHTLFYHAGGMLILFFSALYDLRRIHRGLKRVFHQMYEIGVNTFPLCLMVGLFTGMIVALQTGMELKDFSIQEMIGGIVGVSLLLEMGPVIISFIVTGRVGAAIAAEIGTMTVSEEVDALKSLGINTTTYLVMPRFFAAVTMLPILTGVAVFFGFWGGGLVSSSYLGVSWQLYYEQLYRAIEVIDVLKSVGKTVVFACLFSIICCYMGLQAKNGAQGVGKNTMLAIVVSLTMIIVADYFLNRFYG